MTDDECRRSDPDGEDGESRHQPQSPESPRRAVVAHRIRMLGAGGP